MYSPKSVKYAGLSLALRHWQSSLKVNNLWTTQNNCSLPSHHKPGLTPVCINTMSETDTEKPDLKYAPRQRATNGSSQTVDRLPPHSPEAEMGVLGCILIAPNDCMGECLSKLKGGGSEVFYDLRHQTIFDVLAEMFDKREAIDIITVYQRLKDRQVVEQVGGLAFLSTLPDKVPSAANLTYYLEIVQEKYLLRKMIRVCTEVVGRVYDYEGQV